MAFQPVPNGAEVLIVAEQSGEACYNTFYFTKTGAWGQADLQDLVDEIDPLWAAWTTAFMGNSYSYLRTEARDLRTAIGVQASQDASANTGAVSGAGLPNNTCIALARQSGLTGRSSRGRVYFPLNVAGNLSSNNVVSSTFRAGAITLVTAIGVEALALDWTPVIVSRQQAGVVLTNALTYPIITWTFTDTVADSQRRRLPGRGD